MKLRTCLSTKVLLGTLLAANESVDFVDPAGKAFLPDGSMNRTYGDQLYSALYKLPEWDFLMTPGSFRRKQPSVQVIDGKNWFLVFTDKRLLRAYAAHGCFSPVRNLSSSLIVLKRKACCETAKKVRGSGNRLHTLSEPATE